MELSGFCLNFKNEESYNFTKWKLSEFCISYPAENYLPPKKFWEVKQTIVWEQMSELLVNKHSCSKPSSSLSIKLLVNSSFFPLSVVVWQDFLKGV